MTAALPAPSLALAAANPRLAVLDAMGQELDRTSTVAPLVLVGELELQRVARALERGRVHPSPEVRQ